jgi:hypothetical protein
MFRIIEDHFIERPFRAPLPEIEIHAGGQHKPAQKQCGALPGLNLEKEFDLEQLPHHLKQPLT